MSGRVDLAGELRLLEKIQDRLQDVLRELEEADRTLEQLRAMTADHEARIRALEPPAAQVRRG